MFKKYIVLTEEEFDRLIDDLSEECEDYDCFDEFVRKKIDDLIKSENVEGIVIVWNECKADILRNGKEFVLAIDAYLYLFEGGCND